MKKQISLLTIFLTVQTLTYGQTSQQQKEKLSKEKFVGVWCIEEVRANRVSIGKSNECPNEKYTFDTSNTYVNEACSQVQSGTWLLSKNNDSICFTSSWYNTYRTECMKVKLANKKLTLFQHIDYSRPEPWEVIFKKVD